ncbi:NAC domain-containing protein 68 [Linum grandiflorum]
MMNPSAAVVVSEDGKRRFLVSSEETEVARLFPLGYRFKPSDRELVKHYLLPKSMGSESDPNVIGCIGNIMNASDFYAFPPYDLVCPIVKKEEWYVFIRQDQQSGDSDEDDVNKLTVKRTVGTDGEGFWESLKSFEVTICDHSTGMPIGFKSEYAYYSSCSTRGILKTEWKLDEYRLCNPANPKGEQWVVARLTRDKESYA